ncbi:polysaccharide pyruvyl transferase family protein [Microbacterium sp. NEAU-LLC]|uniref:Polysaccharide pyruvyl transferase family protein n=1 Tax=Microbacterium helvum TaxID=2773713 RepID=A0ABR8NPG7_9MICO|nr:polysaccharide pyruvyl transferase family protein [Microbacterium helvum]MBD3942544.1 polysaccharide pyruvyl transferase family protein [Microbacterium helvum]
MSPTWFRRSKRQATSEKQAVIVGPYRVHNFGDDLIGAIIAKHLQGRGYDVTVPRLGAENAEWLGTRYAADYDGILERSELIVVGGGGIMSDTAGAKPGASYLEIVSRAVADGRITGKPVVVTGVGAGPWVRDKSRKLALEVSDVAEKIGVRDEESRSHLASLGVDTDKIVVGADIALLTSDFLQFRPRRVRRIGLQFDIANFKDVYENPEITEVADAVVRYANANARHVTLVSNGRHRSQLADGAPSCDLMRYVTLKEFLPQLAGVRAMFTSHLHLAITAYSQRIPSFSLYVREKTKRFYDQIGHPERALDLRTATVADFDRLIAQAETVTWTGEDEQRLVRLKSQSRDLLDFVG